MRSPELKRIIAPDQREVRLQHWLTIIDRIHKMCKIKEERAEALVQETSAVTTQDGYTTTS